MADAIREGLPEEERTSFAQGLVDVVPLARMGEAREVASLVAWLLSNSTSFEAIAAGSAAALGLLVYAVSWWRDRKRLSSDVFSLPSH